MAPASCVATLDQLSLPFTIILAAAWLDESMTWKLGAGVTLMVVGAPLRLTRAGAEGSRALAQDCEAVLCRGIERRVNNIRIFVGTWP